MNFFVHIHCLLCIKWTNQLDINFYFLASVTRKLPNAESIYLPEWILLWLMHTILQQVHEKPINRKTKEAAKSAKKKMETCVTFLPHTFIFISSEYVNFSNMLDYRLLIFHLRSYDCAFKFYMFNIRGNIPIFYVTVLW